MIKEIHEQPATVRDTLNSALKESQIGLSDAGLTDDVIKAVSSIHVTAYGAARHVGMAAQYVIEDLAEIPVRVELASEFRCNCWDTISVLRRGWMWISREIWKKRNGRIILYLNSPT